jgi:hypothetical protein
LFEEHAVQVIGAIDPQHLVLEVLIKEHAQALSGQLAGEFSGKHTLTSSERDSKIKAWHDAVPRSKHNAGPLRLHPQFDVL